MQAKTERSTDDPDRVFRARLELFRRYREQRARTWIEAIGSSMLPSIREGDWLLVDFAASEP